MNKSTFIAACVACALSTSALAQDADPERTAEQAEELAKNAMETLGDQPRTVLDNADLDAIIKRGEIVDKIRSETEKTAVMSNNESERIEYLDNLRTAKVKAFIVENVPDHILAAGTAEVELYIRQNFIEKDGSDNAPVKQVIWSSDASPLTPDEVRPIWDEPAPQPEEGNVISEPSEPAEEPESAQEPKPDAIDTSDALAALGMTQEELDNYLGQPSEPSRPEPVSMETSVAVKNIDVDRVVILGKRSYVNATLSFVVSKGGQNRAVERRYKEIKEGFVFDIDGVPFELIEINPSVVAFENLQDRTTHRALVQ